MPHSTDPLEERGDSDTTGSLNDFIADDDSLEEGDSVMLGTQSIVNPNLLKSRVRLKTNVVTFEEPPQTPVIQDWSDEEWDLDDPAMDADMLNLLEEKENASKPVSHIEPTFRVPPLPKNRKL